MAGLTAAFGTWQVWAAMAALNTACVLAFADDLGPRWRALFHGSALVVAPLGLALPLVRRIAPTTVKGRVRAELWHSLEAAHAEGRVQTGAVRASDFFGPGVAMSSFGESVFGRLARGRAAQILGDPDTRHSVTYIPDYAAALLRVAGLFSPAAKEMVEMLPEFTADFVMDSSVSEKGLELAPTDLDAAIATTAAGHR